MLRKTPHGPYLLIHSQLRLRSDMDGVGATVSLVLSKIHRDPAVYGDDFEDFKPERMYEENFERLPNGAWKPFGNGSRACIVRPFFP